VRPQVASKGVPPAAGIVAEVALEGLLSGVQLDVPQQVALLGEGGPTLIALERSFSCGKERRVDSEKKTQHRPKRTAALRQSCFPWGPVTSTGCRFDRTRGFQTKPASSLTLHWLGQFDLKI
jgi:hypothetical protein